MEPLTRDKTPNWDRKCYDI